MYVPGSAVGGAVLSVLPGVVAEPSGLAVTVFGAAAVVLALAFLRRRRPPEEREPSEKASPSPAAPPKRSLFRKSSRARPSEPTSGPAPTTSAVPEYFEGPPEPAPVRSPPGRRAGGGAPPSEAPSPPPDLDALLAQLEQLSEQIRRRQPPRVAKPPTDGEAEPSAPGR